MCDCAPAKKRPQANSAAAPAPPAVPPPSPIPVAAPGWEHITVRSLFFSDTEVKNGKSARAPRVL